MPPLTALPPPAAEPWPAPAAPATPAAGAAPATPAAPAARARVVPWYDPVVEAAGIDPRSAYVEHFWLPVLGPSATWLVRRFADLLDVSPQGTEIDLGTLARSLGVGGMESRHAPLRRALRRCARFGVLRAEAPDRLAVRRLLGPVPQRLLAQLPEELQVHHRRWVAPDATAEAVRRRARLLVLDAVVLGAPGGTLEQRLQQQGLHPALAHEAARWAHERTAGPPSPDGPP